MTCLTSGSDDFHDRSDGSFRHTVELVDMRRARRPINCLRLDVLSELAGKELAGVIHFELTDDAYRLGFAYARQRVELCHERANPLQRLRLLLEEVDLLETRVVVD